MYAVDFMQNADKRINVTKSIKNKEWINVEYFSYAFLPPDSRPFRPVDPLEKGLLRQLYTNEYHIH